MLLFVYGTLKRGERNHQLLAGQRFIGPAVTAPGFRLFDLGDYPGMVRAAGGVVRGELFDVSDHCREMLDVFEGVPTLFDRATIDLADGTQASAYLYARPVLPAAAGGEEWPLGG